MIPTNVRLKEYLLLYLMADGAEAITNGWTSSKLSRSHSSDKVLVTRLMCYAHVVRRIMKYFGVNAF